MLKKNFVKVLILIFIFFLVIFFYIKFSKKIDDVELKQIEDDEIENFYNSNIIENVKYTTKDADGNEYIITARQGEIDYSEPNILFLTNVEALIKLIGSDNVTITSDFGKYNSDNFDTIFSKNVIIKYLDNQIIGEYLDFSLERNSMIISKKVVYTNLDNILKADVIEVDIKTKNTKIFMYNREKKVNIKSKN